ncbi:PD-(D/E)XK motif protein [Rhodococcus sp. JVH1]|uniref:PD-(D/E)XK motif protein n=1 Tax=Rhodococcus sp. JVH1 TaxID=745408 RepID=UPI0012F6FD37|nr:PD-(D/E)XK motif protein [Rhodococcus sp. JVH1]
MTGASARHTPIEVISDYNSQGIKGSFVIDGVPAARVQLAPQDRLISLLVEVTENVIGPDLRLLANLDYDIIEDAGTMWHRLDVSYDDNLAEVYPVLCTTIDLVQLNGETFTDAVESVLAGLGDILTGRGGLPHEKQVGLFGELIVLLSIAQHYNSSDAVAAWRGPDREEHDFGLPDSDVEVKTTLSEQRAHWISSLTQLQPTVERALYLLSIQITSAANSTGATLAELVESVRELPGIPLGEVDRHLEANGYYARHADLYRARWALRSAPAFYLVDDEFPAFTATRVGECIPNSQRVRDIRYRINLDGLVSAAPLFAITKIGATTA